MQKGKTAIIIGATGLVGNHLLKILLGDSFYSQIIILSRRNTTINNNKLKEYIVDFNKPETYEDLVKGDVLFSCMGTTIKKAGSKGTQWKIDIPISMKWHRQLAKMAWHLCTWFPPLAQMLSQEFSIAE